MKKMPSRDRLINIIKDILRARLEIQSQEELCRHALKQLREEDKNYILSPIRAKRVALAIPEIEVKAKTKKVVRLQKIDKCPICDSAIEPLKVKNLLNKEIVIGYKCTECAYESDLEAFMPMKYIFIWKHTYLR